MSYNETFVKLSKESSSMSVKPTTVTKEGKEIFNISWHAIGPEEVLESLEVPVDWFE